MMRIQFLFGRFVACAALIAATVFSSGANAATLLIDFGRGNTNDGRTTVGPDANGNYWNNFNADAMGIVGLDVPVGSTISNLVTTSNAPTAIGVKTNTVIRANGRNNGGLFSPNGPSAALLGNFAIETATEDYFFTETGGSPALNNHADLQILGLNPAATYDFRLFGTRAVGSARRTRYTMTGGNGPHSAELVTSGPATGANGVYNGNDDEIVSITGVTPNVNNQIRFDIDAVAGGFGYIAILEITETLNVPEPTAALLAMVGGFTLVGARRRR